MKVIVAFAISHKSQVHFFKYIKDKLDKIKLNGMDGWM